MSKVVNALMFSAPRFSKGWVHFLASSFFSLSCRTSTLSTLSLSGLFFPSIFAVPWDVRSRWWVFQHLFGSAERNSVWTFSFTVTAVENCSNQILNCPEDLILKIPTILISPFSSNCFLLRKLQKCDHLMNSLLCKSMY